MRATLVFLAIVISGQLFSQNIDSIKVVVERTTASDKFEVILGYMRSLLQRDAEASYSVSKYALEYALMQGDSILVTRALYAQGFLLRRLNQESKAELILKRAYGIAKRNSVIDELSKIINMLAILSTYKANYDEALRYNFEALEINEKRNTVEDIAVSYNNIGLVYFKISNFREAIKFYESSLSAKQRINSKFDLDRLYINMALCYNQLGQYREAERSIKKALESCGEECSDEVKMGATLGLGISLLEQGRAEESKEQVAISLDISKKLKNTRFEIENLSTLARAHLATGRTTEALAVLKDVEAMSMNEQHLEPLLYVYRKFSDIYTEKKDYEKSALYTRKYSDLRDSIYGEKLLNNIAAIQSRYAERENLSTIADNERVIRAQRNLNYAIAFIVIMAFAFIYLIMHNSRAIRRLNAKLALEVEKKTKELVRTNHYLKQVNDELDNLVYKTSHDIRGPLATLKGICNIALMDVKDREAIVFLKKLDNTSTLLNQVLDKFSRVNEIYNAYVVPKPVDIRKLLEDILHTQNKTERLKPIDVQTEIATLEGFESEPRLLYYVLNSIIDNAFRYYNESSSIASYVKVKVEQAKDEVMIRIIDNGVGIPINIDSDSLFHMFTRGSERSLTGGMGLFIATIATRKLQGEIEFHRSDDFLLTEFVLTLPLKMDLARIEKPRERGSQSASPLGIAVNHSTVNQ
jgi:signal transduction histidine kinase